MRAGRQFNHSQAEWRYSMSYMGYHGTKREIPRIPRRPEAWHTYEIAPCTCIGASGNIQDPVSEEPPKTNLPA